MEAIHCEAFEDCTIWLEAILHWHFWAEAQTFLKESEPSVLILYLSSFFFSFQWYQNHRAQSLSCRFKLQWIMALKLFSVTVKIGLLLCPFPKWLLQIFAFQHSWQMGFLFSFSAASEASKNVSNILWLSLTLSIKFLRVLLLYLHCN